MDFNHPPIESSSIINIKVSTKISIWSMVSGTVTCVVLDVIANIFGTTLKVEASCYSEMLVDCI